MNIHAAHIRMYTKHQSTFVVLYVINCARIYVLPLLYFTCAHIYIHGASSLYFNIIKAIGKHCVAPAEQNVCTCTRRFPSALTINHSPSVTAAYIHTCPFSHWLAVAPDTRWSVRFSSYLEGNPQPIIFTIALAEYNGACLSIRYYDCDTKIMQ